MIPGDSPGTGRSNRAATCNRLGSMSSMCGDGATNAVATEGQIKPFLRGGPEEQMLMPMRRLENN